MDVLNARLESLERSVLSADGPTSTENVSEQVALIERQLGRVLADHAPLTQGLEKYDRLKGIIDGDGDLDLSRRLLGLGAKTELILLNNGAMQTLADLRTIRDLQSKISQPEYSAAAELLPRARELEQRHCQQAAELKQAVADISSVVDRYHSETEALSELFIRWDQILAGLECGATELETKRRRG
ncbi:hypothetical protein GGI04_001232 [Coemansia thaxteri]|uniref:Dynactin subunit 3 n=1 Tax=Coemansia thaxteri TaxID=2663907 RepID=A0A9W8BGI4_9FUNG|nr:hypothetical protein H4R26_001121 [Coemansia thaxteri]KAJ2008182.1 hypothetical protein GGI04_001232 [Coemansia thaxteri]KAJ2472151.1 hypothetical protein GGI02_001781 [Coemansia sp. RSA 2322]KAJ2485534.1 hypothetical protein EV174_001658 [Coemansia sp. RSA 2320]